MCGAEGLKSAHSLELRENADDNGRMRRVALLGALLFLATRAAAAEPSTTEGAVSHAVALHWAAPDACPDSRSIVSRVEGLLGHAVTASPGAPFAVEARATQTGAQAWTLDVSFREGENPTSRTVTAASCDELADAAALFIALAIDPNFTKANPPPSAAGDSREPATVVAANAAAPPPLPPLASRPETRAVTASKPEPAGQPPLRIHLGALGGLWFERLPSVAPGFTLTTAVSRRRWRLTAELGFYPERHAEVAATQTGGDIWLASAELNLGYTLVETRLQLAPFAGLELDWMHGSGTGQLRAEQGSTMMTAFNVGARLEYFVSPRWALQARGKASAPFQRPSFDAGDVEVFRPSRVAAEFGLGAAVTFR